MEKTRTKGRELLKVVAVSVLSIGLLSAGFLGFNRLAFAAAVNGAELLPQATASATAILNSQPEQQGIGMAMEAEVFVPPAITIVAAPWLNEHPNNTVTASAMPMEEAAQIAALYIWDVFGESIDGMYVQMSFGAWPSQTRTYWTGTVGRSMEAFDVERHRRYLMGESDYEDDFDYALFRFTIDAVTGMRVGIGRNIRPIRIAPEVREEMNREVEERRDAGVLYVPEVWLMDTSGRMAHLGLLYEDIEPYIQAAKAYATRHFNNSTVVYETLNFEIMLNGSRFTNDVTFWGITATIEDNTGRNANMILRPDRVLIRFCTLDSDMVPGFNYGGDGIG